MPHYITPASGDTKAFGKGYGTFAKSFLKFRNCVAFYKGEQLHSEVLTSFEFVRTSLKAEDAQ
jgi:hypothetical protein